MSHRIRMVSHTPTRLGESPLWDPDSGLLYWVDSVGPLIWRLDPATGAQESFAAPLRIGSIALGAPGALIAGLEDGLYRVDLEARAFTPIIRPEILTANERLNDGKADRTGRLVTGSLGTDHANPHTGRLYRFDVGGGCAVLETGIAVSNSICFSPTGDRLYFSDSLQRILWAYDYDAATGAATNRRDLVNLDAMGITPDGATVDAEGFIWVALVLTQQLGRFSPDGAVERIIDLPVPYPACPAFGGEALDQLYMTSIADSGGRLKSDHPNAGALFVIEGLGVTGLPEPRCRL